MTDPNRQAFDTWKQSTNEFLGLCLAQSKGQPKPTLRTARDDGHFVDVFLGDEPNKRQLEPQRSAFSDAVSFTYWMRLRLDRAHLTVHESSFAVTIARAPDAGPVAWLRVDYEREKPPYHQSHIHLGAQDFHIPIGHSLFRPTFEDVVLASISEAERIGRCDDASAAAAISARASKTIRSWEKVQTRRAVRSWPKVALDELVVSGQLPLPIPLNHAELRRFAEQFSSETREGSISMATRDKVLDVLGALDRLAERPNEDLR